MADPKHDNVVEYSSSENGIITATQPGLFDHLPDLYESVGIGIRSLRLDQYNPNIITPGVLVIESASIQAVIGEALCPTGMHTDAISGLYAFVRQGRGAGFQAVTRNPGDRPNLVIRNFEKSTGEVMATIELSNLDEVRLFDFQNPVVQANFLARFPRFGKQVRRFAQEGVVAVRYDIAKEVVLALIRTIKPTKEDTLHAAMDRLLRGRQ